MDTVFDENSKSMASTNNNVGCTCLSAELSTESLQKFIAEFREELNAEISGISVIKW